MPDLNPSNHALLNMISRCLSGQWLIDPTWLFQNADLLARAERGDDMSNVWQKLEAQSMVSSGGVYAAADKTGTIGKGQALGVINFSGPVYKYGWNSSKMLLSTLDMMAKDERIGGVKLIIDSPGGQVSGTREVYQAIANFPKSILSVIDGYAASAGYYYIAGSSRIVTTQPTDQAGSIGTYTTLVDWNGFYKSMGIDLYEIYAKASTQKNEEYRQVMESKGKDTELMQNYITMLNDQFLADVKEGRGDRLTGKGQDPLAGRLFFSSEGIKNGIIDEQINSADTLGLLADMVATNKQSTIQMSKIKDLGTAIAALLSSAEKEEETGGSQTQTVEQLTAQVTTLTTERDTAQASVVTLTTERDAARASVTTLTTERDNAQAQVVTLTGERDTAQALATQYGAQPGERPTNAAKAKDEIPAAQGDTKTTAQRLAELPSEQEAARMFPE